jgi:uncharacterized membrane protein YqjE
MKANPARIIAVAFAALVWTLIVAFALSDVGRTGPVNAVIAVFAAIWNIAGLWLIRVGDGVSQSALGDHNFGAHAKNVSIHREAVWDTPASIPLSKQ